MKSTWDGILASIFHRFWWTWGANLGGQIAPKSIILERTCSHIHRWCGHLVRQLQENRRGGAFPGISTGTWAGIVFAYRDTRWYRALQASSPHQRVPQEFCKRNTGPRRCFDHWHERLYGVKWIEFSNDRVAWRRLESDFVSQILYLVVQRVSTTIAV